RNVTGVQTCALPILVLFLGGLGDVVSNLLSLLGDLDIVASKLLCLLGLLSLACFNGWLFSHLLIWLDNRSGSHTTSIRRIGNGIRLSDIYSSTLGHITP